MKILKYCRSMQKQVQEQKQNKKNPVDQCKNTS